MRRMMSWNLESAPQGIGVGRDRRVRDPMVSQLVPLLDPFHGTIDLARPVEEERDHLGLHVHVTASLYENLGCT